MLIRQKVIINLIRLAGGQASRLQVVKWAFLLGQEHSDCLASSFYQFLPYKYGPYSFLLSHEMERMACEGLISLSSNHNVDLNVDAISPKFALDYGLSTIMQDFMHKHRELSISSLLNIVYSKYPWFASKSNLISDHSPSHPKAMAIYTAGFGGCQIDGFLNHLLKYGITRIIDVRYNPCSRKYGFHGSTLSKLSNNINIQYTHIRDLGVPAEWRNNTNTQKEYNDLSFKYINEQLRTQPELLKELAHSFMNEPSVLVCQEADPSACHRSILASELAQISGLQVVNTQAWNVHQHTGQLEF